jgi:excinuclease ABC subunit A
LDARYIKLRGARQHNLRNIDLDLPRQKLVVITGVSGSGKSSLAFDTIFAEGQRRYVESLSTYARNFLQQLSGAQVDRIEGLSPTIAVQQRSMSRNPRSVVATVTELHEHFRLLFAHIGRRHCTHCGEPVDVLGVQAIVERLLSDWEGRRVLLLAPELGAATEELLEKLRRDGFVRLRLGQSTVLLDELSHEHGWQLGSLDGKPTSALIDRLELHSSQAARLADSIETALQLAAGRLRVEDAGSGESQDFSSLRCAACGTPLQSYGPRSFSFNSPEGACTSCSGLGYSLAFEHELLVPDPSKSVMEGAIVAMPQSEGAYSLKLLENVLRASKVDPSTPFDKLPKQVVHKLLYGTQEAIDYVLHDPKKKRHYEFSRPWEGVVPWLTRRYRETSSEMMRAELERFMRSSACSSCGGSRLRAESLAVRLGERNIAQWCALSIAAVRRELASLALSERQQRIGGRLLAELEARLSFLDEVGLGYLTLDRTVSTLSGGEAQRIRLGSQLGSSLTGIIYVLDEPSIGLHAKDQRRLLDALAALRDRGNTVIVVEHDEDAIRAADWVVDMGPGAGRAGGRVVCAGPVSEIEACEASLTGAYLSGRRQVSCPLGTWPVPPNDAPRQAQPGNGEWLQLRGARRHNLQSIDVELPLGCMVTVAGVSGSGKSTLVAEVLLDALRRRMRGAEVDPALCSSLSLKGNPKAALPLDKLIEVDQSPIGKSPRSNPATYIGLFDPIRELFSKTEEARARGYKASRFSFNVKGGRCEACQGDGVVRYEMHFLPDVDVRCESCGGLRYNRETLQVLYRGLSIADVLAMSAVEALPVFSAIPACRQRLQVLVDVGLGYLALGQSATTLSGGEAQRLKLAKELARPSGERCLYVLDEPTTGLHFEDVRVLMEVLRALVARGHSLLLIEHNLHVLRGSDWLIELGPGGGDEGGRLVAACTPAELAQLQTPTGFCLR